MKKKSSLYFVLLMALSFTFILTSCQTGPDSRELDVLETMGQIQNDFAVLVDIREGQIFEIAEPAHLIPASEIKSNSTKWQDFLQQQHKEKRIIFYGHDHHDALTIAQKVAKQGRKTGHLKDFTEWTAADLPTKKIGHEPFTPE